MNEDELRIPEGFILAFHCLQAEDLYVGCGDVLEVFGEIIIAAIRLFDDKS